MSAGLVAWLIGQVTGSLASGVIALWLFVAAAVAIALVLPFPLAVVSPLYMGLAGWLVDMLPLVILAGWTTVVARWALGLVKERRLPRGGRWIWLPIILFGWTMLGAQNVPSEDFKHFLLLLGIQGLSSGIMLAVVDVLASREDRRLIATALVGFGVVCTIGVSIQYLGIPVQEVQDEEISERIEEAYGLDAFPNSVGMLNYVLASRKGGGEVRRRLARFTQTHPETPPYNAYAPPFRAFEEDIVVRFAGSATHVAEDLREIDVELLYDNVGIAPSNKVPRWRSFPRNALTYAGICVALFPLSLYLAWCGRGWRRILGRASIASCLMGAGFALARGAWVAILIGIAYLMVEGTIAGRRKSQAVAAYVAAAALFSALFVVKYGVDPLTGRAHGEGSVGARASVYEDTIEAMTGRQVIFGSGTTKVRSRGAVAARYVPRAGTHSTYLNYAFRTGIPGLIAIVAVYAIAWLHARASARMRDGDESIFATTIAAAIFAVAAHAAILSLYAEPIYTLSISLIVGLAMAGVRDLPGSVIAFRPKPAD
jgi:hypothetical protein